MFSSRFLSTALLAALLAGQSISATAQGIFDMPPIAGAAPDAPVAQTAPTTAPVARGPLDFEVSQDLRNANQEKFLSAMEETYPGVFTPEAKDQDFMALLAPELAKYGLRVDNLGDAFTAWLMISHSIVTQDEADPTTEQVAGTKKMAQDAMMGLPELGQMSDSDKQSTAEALLFQAMLNDAVYEATKEHQPDNLPKVIEEVRNAAKESNIDLDKFVMTPNGLQLAQ